MTNELIVSGNESEEAFIAMLNNATGFTGGLPTIPTLKFDAQVGKFLRSTGEKDKEGKPLYDELKGDMIQIHIITTRKMVRTKYKVEPFLSSREYTGNYVELFNEDKKVVLKGMYKDLKANNPNLVYAEVMYVMFEGKPYKFRLTGSKLQNLFEYYKSFQNDSLACWMTVVSKGQQLVNGAVKYYELNFAKGERITDKLLIAQRVNDTNMYIKLINQARNAQYQNDANDFPTYDQSLPGIEAGNEAPLPDEDFEPEEDEIDLTKIPF